MTAEGIIAHLQPCRSQTFQVLTCDQRKPSSEEDIIQNEFCGFRQHSVIFSSVFQSDSGNNLFARHISKGYEAMKTGVCI